MILAGEQFEHLRQDRRVDSRPVVLYTDGDVPTLDMIFARCSLGI